MSPVPSETLLILARHVLPVSSPPILDGAVMVHDGVIGAVGPAHEIALPPGTIVKGLLDLGESVLMPGLVNAHSHIEYTLLRGFDDTLELFPWVRKLTALKTKAMEPADFEISARLGACELIRAGVTAIGDCTDNGLAVMKTAAACGLRARAYQEVFGILDEQCEESLAGLREKLERLRGLSVAGLTDVGISPHAPYTVSRRLFRECARLAREQGCRLAVHAAESDAEVSFVRNGSGPIGELFAARGLPWAPAGVSPIAYLESLGLLELGNALQLIHCVKALPEDLEQLAWHGVGLAHCPRSNAKLGNGVFPSGALGGGLRVGIGTDSAASNNALSVLEEVRFAAPLHRAAYQSVHGADASRMLRLATLGGAESLGLDRSIGSIEVGKAADLCAFSLEGPEYMPCEDPAAALVWGAPPGHARLTMVAGKVLCQDGRLTTTDVGALLAEARERAGLIRKRFGLAR